VKLTAKLWIGIALLALFSPLGLLLPEWFKAGPAWGEGGGKIVWHAPFPEYALKGWDAGALRAHAAYIVSAIVGIAATAAVVLLLSRGLSKKDAGIRRKKA
jgi:hypothetical protein